MHGTHKVRSVTRLKINAPQDHAPPPRTAPPARACASAPTWRVCLPRARTDASFGAGGAGGAGGPRPAGGTSQLHAAMRQRLASLDAVDSMLGIVGESDVAQLRYNLIARCANANLSS